MQQHHNVSPFIRPFRRTSAPHEGEQFLQHLAGRGAAASAASGHTPAVRDEAPADWPDLDQRVRAIGEW